MSGEASEKGKEGSVLFEMIEEVRQWGGENAIEWLLMDALYADGPVIARLKYQLGIDTVVRLPEKRVMYNDLWQLLARHPQRWQKHGEVRYVAGRKQSREVKVAAMEKLDGWDAFVCAAQAYGAIEPSLYGVAIESVDKLDPREKEEWALVSTAPFPTAWRAYSFWRRRWGIENQGFREIKEGWHLEESPWSYTDDTVVLARLTFTLLAFNVAQVAKTKKGAALTQHGIRRLRRHLRQQIGSAPIIVFANGAYGIFDIEEIMAFLHRPPLHSLRRPVRAP